MKQFPEGEKYSRSTIESYIEQKWNNSATNFTNLLADTSIYNVFKNQAKYIDNATEKLTPEAEDKIRQQKGVSAAVDQMEEVRKKYYGTDKWLKAPNGKDTNLTERQWLQVRTENFKKWFGDWELLNTLKEVFNADPVAELTGTEFSKIEGESLVDRVFEYYQSLDGQVKRDEIGVINLSKRGIQSSIAHGIGRNKAVAFKAVPEIIKQGFIISKTEDYRGRGYTSYVIDATILINNEPYIGEVVINKEADKNSFYLHEVEIKNKFLFDNQVRTYEGEPLRNTKTGTSKLIIGKLWDEVNGKTSLVVDENGEPLVVYHGARTDQKFTVFGNKANFFTDNREVAEMFAGEYAYRLIVDGEEYALDRMSARSIAGVIEPVDVDDIMKSFDGGIDNILDDWVTTEQLNDLVDIGGIQIGIDSFDGAEKISILPPSNKIFEVFLDIRNPQTVDFEGRFWEVGDDEKLTPKEGYDGVIARNIIEGGLATELEIPTTDYVVSNANQIKSATDNNGDFSIGDDDIRYQDSATPLNQTIQGHTEPALIKSSFRFDKDTGKYYISGDVYDEIVEVMRSSFPIVNNTVETEVRKTATLATAFLTSLSEDTQDALVRKSATATGGKFLTGGNENLLRLFFNMNELKDTKDVNECTKGLSLSQSAKIILGINSDESTIRHEGTHIIWWADSIFRERAKTEFKKYFEQDSDGKEIRAVVEANLDRFGGYTAGQVINALKNLIREDYDSFQLKKLLPTCKMHWESK